MIRISWKEWIYQRVKKRIKTDMNLLGYIFNRIQKNRRKLTKMENEREMMVIDDVSRKV